VTSRSVVRCFGSSSDPRPALLALAIAHQARIAAERSATAGDARRAQAARRAAEDVARALVEFERLILPDRAAWVALQSRHNPLQVPGTATPVERAWVLGWHLLAAAARLHGSASAGGRPSFGERETAHAVLLIREALSELKPLVSPKRQIELRASLVPAALSMDAQLRLFAPAIVGCSRPAR
jgi:hypothetical protein